MSTAWTAFTIALLKKSGEHSLNTKLKNYKTNLAAKKEDNGHCYLVKSIDLISKEILVATNKYSLEHLKTINFLLN
jgi:hypothetical protein